MQEYCVIISSKLMWSTLQVGNVHERMYNTNHCHRCKLMTSACILGAQYTGNRLAFQSQYSNNALTFKPSNNIHSLLCIKWNVNSTQTLSNILQSQTCLEQWLPRVLAAVLNSQLTTGSPPLESTLGCITHADVNLSHTIHYIQV